MHRIRAGEDAACDIHSVVFATIDENQFPVTCVIDIMLADKDGLYFLTAKGKAFYERLQNQPLISITGMIGNDFQSEEWKDLCNIFLLPINVMGVNVALKYAPYRQ